MLYIFVVFITFFLYVINRIVPQPKVKIIGVIVIMIGGVTIIVLAMNTIYMINLHIHNKLNNAIIHERNIQQRNYYELLLERENKTKAFRHDIIDELLILKNYINTSNYDNATTFIDSMLKDISVINRTEYVVGNSTIDILLNYYLVPIKDECKINVTGNVSDDLNIEDKDLCIVVANVLKNSVAAIKSIDQDQKFINIDIKNGKNFFNIKVTNPFIDKVFPAKDNNDRSHGYGLLNIKNIVKKYNGVYDIKKENNIFDINISLQIA